MSTSSPGDDLGPIYIGGLDRSGKTTMRGFLTSHPSISIPAVGSNMWTYFYGQYGDLQNVNNFERCLSDLLRYKHVRFLQPDPERIRTEFWRGPRTYAHLFELFLVHYSEREHKPRWGCQTGLIEQYADHLFSAHPNLKLIHMVRDPRDRYEASLALWPNGKGRAGGATARWLYSIRLAERNRARYPTGYLLVRFEDLVERPAEILQQVCDFIGEPFDARMLSMPDAPKHKALLETGANGQLLSPSFVGRFRHQLDSGELAYIQGMAGREMVRYGYALQSFDWSWQQRAAFWASEWPRQAIRQVAWRTKEAAHQNLPRVFGRKPGKRMILAEAA